jgi:hypothetical protein
MSDIEEARQAIARDPDLLDLWRHTMTETLANTGDEILAYEKAASMVLAAAWLSRLAARRGYRWI